MAGHWKISTASSSPLDLTPPARMATRTPETAGDHRSIDFSPVVWSLLLNEARNLPSDEKLEFYLKGRENVA
mgnify:FL=1